ncbi:glycosyltransferase family 2 protein [Aeromonas veronii]
MHPDSMPLVSVIIPIYNVEAFLSQCIESILAQTYSNIELILVNDGSPDNSDEICKKYLCENSGKIVYIYQENSGCSNARNKGIQVAKGEFISFVDGDDYLPASYYSTIMSQVEHVSSQAAFLFCAISFNQSGDMKRAFSFDKPHFDPQTDLHKIDSVLLNSSCNKIFPRKMIVDEGITFPVGTHFSEDMAFVLKALSVRGKAIFVEGTHYIYNIHPGGITSQCDEHHIQRFCNESLVTYTDIKQFYQKVGFADDVIQTQIIKSLIPDFYSKLSFLAKNDNQITLFDKINTFEKMLTVVANEATMKTVRKLRIKYTIKLFVFRYLYFLVELYRLIKGYLSST